MDNLLAWLFFLVKLIFAMFLIGIPLLLIIVFLANALYKRVIPRYEKLKEGKIKEDQSKP